MNKLVKISQNDPSITELSLSNLGKTEIDLISAALVNNTHVKYISIDNIKITPDDIKLLLHILKQKYSTNIEGISLNNTNIGAEGLNCLSTAIRSNNKNNCYLS